MSVISATISSSGAIPSEGRNYLQSRTKFPPDLDSLTHELAERASHADPAVKVGRVDRIECRASPAPCPESPHRGAVAANWRLTKVAGIGGPLPASPPEGLCPACRAPALRGLLETSGPIHTSKLLPTREEAIRYPRGSITLALCESCGLLTNTSFVAPTHDYSASYEETQLFSPRFQEYAHWLATTLGERHGLAGTEVLEIGCGRADFLLTLCETADCGGVGVDPSFREARLEGPAADRVSVRRAFFGEGDIDRSFSLVVCRHTLEHVHDVHDFLTRLRGSLAAAPQAPVLFEVPDVGRILRETAFWDVFYEHVTYFTPGSLARAFRAAGLHPTNLELEFDDQYVLLTAVPDDQAIEADTLALEEPVTVTVAEADGFVRELGVMRDSWAGRLRERRAQGERCVIWGAGSKGVGFLSTLELSDEVACAVDVNPAKHGMFMPGTGHEIVAPAQLREIRPSLVVVMNPVYVDEIRHDLGNSASTRPSSRSETSPTRHAGALCPVDVRAELLFARDRGSSVRKQIP